MTIKEEVAMWFERKKRLDPKRLGTERPRSKPRRNPDKNATGRIMRNGIRNHERAVSAILQEYSDDSL